MEESDAKHSDRLAGREERINGLLDRACRRAHHDDDTFGVRGAVIVDEPVTTAGALRELIHRLRDDRGHLGVEGVARLTRLEEHVGVLGGAPHVRCVRRHPACAVLENVVVAHERAQVALIEERDLVHLVRCAEAVEEVQERHSGAQGRGV